ncbi:MAG: response regulator [Hyphomicrobium sp.]
MQHCLIVDDSSVIRKFARLIFEQLGYRVSEAANAVETLDRIESDPPDLVLMDWILPGDNCHELIAAIRSARLDRRPFIIYLVTECEPSDIKRAVRAGADDYLMKPFNRDIIEMKLHEISVAA